MFHFDPLKIFPFATLVSSISLFFQKMLTFIKKPKNSSSSSLNSSPNPENQNFSLPFLHLLPQFLPFIKTLNFLHLLPFHFLHLHTKKPKKLEIKTLNHHFQPKNGHYYWWLTNCTVNIQKNIFIHEQIFMGLFMFCVDC
jgi:hypothetical protein